MQDALKPLLDSDALNEETKKAISQAWEDKLAEASDELKGKFREEFASRYEHDKKNMVEAIDNMVTESLTKEIEKVKAESKSLAEDRVKFTAKMKEKAEKFDKFLVSKLAEEIKDLREDRKSQQSALGKMEKFVVKALAKEITEFAQDKKDVVETKVKLIADAKDKLQELKDKFVSQSSKKMSESVSKHLKSELSQLREDIKVARENNFGRTIFEAYASEFAATHLNENAEIKKLREAVAEKDKQLEEATKNTEETKQLAESVQQELRIAKDNQAREKAMTDLLAPLNGKKQDVMRNLLESVQTDRLNAAFEKYLPAVLSDDVVKPKKATLTESAKEVTGDKQQTVKPLKESKDNIVDLKMLAGLK